MNPQRTINERIQIQGVGLHSGKKVRLTLEPAPANHGIVFWREDLKNPHPIQALVQNVVATDLCTTLGRPGSQGGSVATVEHLMSALWSMGIDNCKCLVSGGEIPILDGSSRGFIDQIKKCGVRDLREPRKLVKIREPIEVVGDARNQFARVIPSNGFEIECLIDFDHQTIGRQERSYSFSKTDYSEEISKARTFGFLHQVEALQRQGLALGGSLKNAIVLDKKGVINPEGLRFQDEFVRHKILDAIGDISLMGYQVIGRFELSCSGHELHRQLVKKILETPSAFQLLEFPYDDPRLMQEMTESDLALA